MTDKVDISFDGGMDQRSHPRQAQAPNVLQAVNVRFKKLGGLEKRAGSKPLATSFVGGYVPQYNSKVLNIRDEVLVVDGVRCGSYTSSAGQDRIIDKGPIPECLSKYQDITTSQYTIEDQDICYSGDNLIFHAWTGLGANPPPGTGTNQYIFWTVQDADTGAELTSSTVPYGSAKNRFGPKLLAMGNTVVMLYGYNPFDTTIPSGSQAIFYRVWDRTNLVFSGEATLLSGLGGTVSCCTDGTFFYVLTLNAAGTIIINKYNSNVILQASYVFTTETGTVFPLGMGIDVQPGGTVWIAYATGNINSNLIVRYACINNSLTALIAGPITIFNPVAGFIPRIWPLTRDASTAVILISYPALSTDTFTTYVLAAPIVSSVSPGIVGISTVANRTTHWAIPISKPFIGLSNPQRIYIWAYVGGAATDPNLLVPPLRPMQFTSMLIDILAYDTATIQYVARPITWQAPRTSAPQGTNSLFATFLGGLCSVAPRGNGKFVTDAVVRRSGAGRQGLAMLTADFQSTDRYESAELGRTLFMTPGWYWDRSKWIEISYSYWPQVGRVTVDGTGAAAAFTSSFRGCYETLDGNLFTHRSDVSEPFYDTTGTGNTNIAVKVDTANFTFTIPAQGITMRQGAQFEDQTKGIRIAIYRQDTITATGAQTPWTLFCLIQNTPLTAMVTATIPIGGDSTVDKTYPEGVYTDGGVLANVMPPGFSAIATYRNRIVVAQGHTIYFSKSFVTGDTVNFTDAFNLPLEETGDITALWVMDDTLFISTTSRIYYTEFNGPTDTNAESDIQQPNRVATDLGVLDQRSIAVTPIGTLYQSTVGIQLMDRNRSVDSEPVGSRVQVDLANFPVISSAIVHPTGRYVSFACNNSGNPNLGIRLIFDYALNRWSRDCHASNGVIAYGNAIICEVVRDGLVYFMTASGSTASALYREDPTTNVDAGTWVTMAVEVAETHPESLQGWLLFQKWIWMHEKLTEYNFRIDWFRDYETSAFDTRIWTSDNIDGFVHDQGSGAVRDFKAQSMRVLMQDQAPTGPGSTIGLGSGARWIGLRADVQGIDNKANRLPANQKQ